MTENNAAQPGLTDDEIRDIITDAHQAYGAFKTGYGLALGRAIESALLSKLRAEGVQAGDERAALKKLVDLEDMRIRLRALHESGHGTDYDYYRKALPAAWEAARAALASAPVALSETERSAITGLIAVARAAFTIADDAEDDGDQIKVDRADADVLGAALDTLDELPDDQPGYAMGPSNKAEWALRRLLDVASAPVADKKPIQLSDDVLQFLKDGVADATQCEESDVDQEFADQLLLLIHKPLYTEPLADYREPEWGPLVIAPVAGEAQKPLPLGVVLGLGEYIIQHTAPGEAAQIVFSVATQHDRETRKIGDRMNLKPGLFDQSRIRGQIQFSSVAGLDALEAELRDMREAHWPETVDAAPQASEAVDLSAVPDITLEVEMRKRALTPKVRSDQCAYELGYFNPSLSRPAVEFAHAIFSFAYQCGQADAQNHAPRNRDFRIEQYDEGFERKDGGDCAKGAGDEPTPFAPDWANYRQGWADGLAEGNEAIDIARTALMEIADLADVEADQRGGIVNEALTRIDEITARAALAAQKHPRTDGGGHE